MRRLVALAPLVPAAVAALWVVRAGHPMGVPFLLLALVGGACVWAEQGFAAMALGVAGSSVGTLLGLSMGWWGIAIAALVALAGAALPGRMALRAGAVAAVVLAPALALPASARGWTDLLALGAMLPGIVWFLLHAWARRRAALST